MLHAKFQNHRPSGYGEKDFLKVFAIYSHGSHLGHVTLTIYIHFHSMLLIKFGLIGQAVSEKTIFEYDCNIHIFCPGVGADRPLGSKFFQNHQS